ncbi:unnamed protein product, partial [Prorocentrum cordatum]
VKSRITLKATHWACGAGSSGDRFGSEEIEFMKEHLKVQMLLNTELTKLDPVSVDSSGHGAAAPRAVLWDLSPEQLFGVLEALLGEIGES